MYALVDATSFYASAEKVFDPKVRYRPLAVLSNNDGCIVALCPIAKQLGIPKFKPYFQIRDLLHKHQVVIRSSNYELYADLSEKMMQIIGRFCDNQYIYSIDESFLLFDRYNKVIDDWQSYGHAINSAVWNELRLPVGVGFGKTVTLAKAANHAAKKLTGYNGVAVINNEQERQSILSRMSLDDVWGVGNRIARRLQEQGISDALTLANQPPKAIRKQFSVVMERTVNELNNVRCISWDEVKSPKREIFSTRSFGQRVTSFEELQKSLSFHAVIVAKKLRQQKSKATKLLVFASSSAHQDNYYKQSIAVGLCVPTNNTLEIANAVNSALYQIYRQGVVFCRSGVGAIELTSELYEQQDLFNSNANNEKLMSCLDAINKRYGQGMLNIASASNKSKWSMRREFLSPQFTTNWNHIPKIKCN